MSCHLDAWGGSKICKIKHSSMGLGTKNRILEHSNTIISGKSDTQYHSLQSTYSIALTIKQNHKQRTRKKI